MATRAVSQELRDNMEGLEHQSIMENLNRMLSGCILVSTWKSVKSVDYMYAYPSHAFEDEYYNLISLSRWSMERLWIHHSISLIILSIVNG